MDVDGVNTGAVDVDCTDSASTSSESRFGQPVSVGEICHLMKDLENEDMKNNTKRVMNLWKIAVQPVGKYSRF